MFEIHVYTSGGKQMLDLQPNSVLSLEETTPWFDRRLKLGTFSLPFEVPWTESNRRNLGGPELLERHGRAPFWEVDVIENGVVEIERGKLEFLQHNGKFTYKNGKSVGSISGGESLYGKSIRGKTLRDLALTGIIQWDNALDARGFANAVMHETNPYPFSFAPIHCEGYIDEGRNDYSGEFLANDVVNQIVLNPAYLDGWEFGRPDPNNPTQVLTPGAVGYNDHATVPFFQLLYLLRRCYEEFGYRVQSDIFTDPDYTSIFIYNNRRLERPSSANTDNIRFMVSQQHVPAMPIAEYLEAVADTLNLGVFYVGNKTFSLIPRKKAGAAAPIDITDFSEDEFESEPTREAVSGYTVRWDIANADQLWSDRVKDVNIKRTIVETFNYTDLIAFTPSTPLADGDLAYIVLENNYYEYNTIDGWVFLSEGNQPIIVEGGEEEYLLKLAPLAQSPKYPRYCGCFKTGTYINNVGVVVTNESGLRIFRIRKQKEANFSGAFSEQVPMTYTNNLDELFGIVNNFSLCLVGQYNIYKILHQPWLNKLLTADIVKTRVERGKIPADRSLPVRIKSNNYLIREVNNDLNSGDGMVEVKLLKL